MKILIFYLAISAVIFLVNLVRYILCSYYQNKYNQNLDNVPENNYAIKIPIFELFDKANLRLIGVPDVGLIANKIYREHFMRAFESAKGFFWYHMIRSPFWLLAIIKHLKIFSPAFLISNKFISALCVVLEAVGVYLLGLFLDTTGIGSRILTFLLDTSSLLLERLAEMFH